MIAEHIVQQGEYIVDESRIVERLIQSYRTSPRGAKPPHNKIRLLLLGMFLTAHSRRTMLLTIVYDTLMNDISIDMQRRLGIVHPTTLEPQLALADFYNIARTLRDKLSWIDTPDSEIPAGTHEYRRDAVHDCCDAVMDVFPTEWESTTVSIDATGIHAWGRSVPSADLAAIDAADLSSNCKRTKHEQLTDPDNENGISASLLASRREWEARWGSKTSKTGFDETFFGYHEHTMVLATPHNMNVGSVPPLIQRFRLTAANADVVEPTLAMVDTAPGSISDILVDRHYHYKRFDRWAARLNTRGIVQHLDLRADELGFTEFESIRWAAGVPHCPGTPDKYGDLARPPLNASLSDKERFEKDIERRQAYALVQHTKPDAEGKRRIQCPALAGKIGCALRNRSVEMAVKYGLPVVADPPSIESHPELPKCCTQQTVSVTPSAQIRKLDQPFYWGSKEWEQAYQRRAYVEGSYGNRKNPATENVDRGQNQVFGLVWLHITHTMINASYNVRRLITWAAQHPQHPNANHPLCNIPHTTSNEVAVRMPKTEYLSLRGITSENPQLSPAAKIELLNRCECVK